MPVYLPNILHKAMNSNSDNFSQFFSKKAYEISYAAFRIGASLKFQSFTESLFGQAFLLLDLAARGQYSECRNIAGSMEYLLRLGGDTGIIHARNAETMVQEIGQFNSAIAEYEKLVDQPAFVNLERSFSKMPVFSPEKKEDPSNLVFPSISHQENNYKGLTDENFQIEQKENINTVAKSVIRQSAILEIIRQSGNCRLKDIQDSFHDVSERTIRYDLQNLIERGLLDRVGSGGPSTYYKAHEVGGGDVVRQA